MDLGDFLAAHPTGIPYDSDSAAWVFVELSKIDFPNVKIGNYVQDLQPDGKLMYKDVRVPGLPDGANAGTYVSVS